MDLAGEPLATLNASLNATSGLLVVAGWLAVRARRLVLHKWLMIAAMTASGLFLVGYVTRVLLHGIHRFEGPPPLVALYRVILFSHVALAATLLPLIVRVAYLAFRGRFAQHVPLARFTLPIWLYVSSTGVVVYVMLYRL